MACVTIFTGHPWQHCVLCSQMVTWIICFGWCSDCVQPLRRTLTLHLQSWFSGVPSMFQGNFCQSFLSASSFPVGCHFLSESSPSPPPVHHCVQKSYCFCTAWGAPFAPHPHDGPFKVLDMRGIILCWIWGDVGSTEILISLKFYIWWPARFRYWLRTPVGAVLLLRLLLSSGVVCPDLHSTVDVFLLFSTILHFWMRGGAVVMAGISCLQQGADCSLWFPTGWSGLGVCVVGTSHPGGLWVRTAFIRP